MFEDADPSSQTGSELSSSDRGAEHVSVPGLGALWAETVGESEICIAILDGPVDTSHPCFQGAKLTPVETLAAGVADSGPASVHGTHVTGIIFGQHHSSVCGIAPGCRGLIVPVFTSGAGGGIAPCSQIDLARAITSAVQYGAHVINISGGQLSASDEAHPLLENAVQHCANSGVLIVAAVGNDGCQCLHVPAAMSSVLAVGAADAHGVPLAVSNWGQAYQGILAPGENIPGAVPSGGIARRSGTSFATPIVSGVVALLLSLQLKQGEKPDPHAVREAILASADPCDPEVATDCPRCLAGQLDVEGARAIITTTTQDLKVAAAAGPLLVKEPPLNPKERGNDMTESNDMESEQAGLPKPAPPDRPGAQTAVPSDAHVAIDTASEQAVPPQTAPRAVAGSANAFANPTGVAPSANGNALPLVYAVGNLSYDFGTEARRDSIQQAMKDETNPYDPKQLLPHFTENPMDAPAVTWTLEIDGTPIYAIQPQGPFASQTYTKLVEHEIMYLLTDDKTRVDRISVGGFISGQTRLLNGQVVPVIVPEPRSLFDWNPDILAQGMSGETPSAASPTQVSAFLDRIYYELRNMGVTPQERAINFATTMAYERMTEVFVDTSQNELELDRIEVEQSPVCRPQSDCWDVKLTFFNPKQRFEEAKRVYRFTVDVSEVIPVTIGKLRSWSEYT